MSARKMNDAVLTGVGELEKPAVEQRSPLKLVGNIILYLTIFVVAVVLGTIAANILALFAGWVNFC